MKNNAVLVYADLVRYWLRIEPSEDMDDFGEEVARAMVIEERFMQQQVAVFSKVLKASAEN